MRRLCARVRVHCAQTVRYTVIKQSGRAGASGQASTWDAVSVYGYTGTLQANSAGSSDRPWAAAEVAVAVAVAWPRRLTRPLGLADNARHVIDTHFEPSFLELNDIL